MLRVWDFVACEPPFFRPITYLEPDTTPDRREIVPTDHNFGSDDKQLGGESKARDPQAGHTGGGWRLGNVRNDSP